MKRLLTSVLLIVCFGSIVLSQEAQDAKTRKLLDTAAKNGNGLRSEISVNGNVHVQAVLIPMVDVRRIFGRNIAENYAVVEVNVGNKSGNAALIIHGIFIDYRHWPVSGTTPAELIADRSTDSYQASNFPTEVASEEYRVVRGQLLDAQTDTLRNRFLRYLTLAGNLAGAFTFSINEQGIIRGIAAANGVGIPGVATAFPDKTIEQLNRVSDFGFRSNKVIPKQASDIIVCFFPIDRFLTPGFRKIYLKRPALFFAPLLMLVDKSVEKDVNDIMGPLLTGLGYDVPQLREALPCYQVVGRGEGPTNPGYLPCLDYFGLEKDPTTSDGRLRVKLKDNKTDGSAFKVFQRFLALEFLRNVTLNRVTITLDGVMAIDVNTVAARIDEITMDKIADCGDANGECFWTNLTAGGGVRTGVIRGAYMKNGDVKIAEAEALHITDVQKIDKGSTDDELHFSFKLNAAICDQKNLTFTVTKSAASEGAKELESNSWLYPVICATTAIGIDSAKLSSDKKTVTVRVRRVNSAAVTFALHPEVGADVPVPAANVAPDATDKNKFVLTIDGMKLTAGCWSVQAESGGLTSNVSNKFAIEPNPTLDTANRRDKFIVVAGTDLIDFGHCGGQRITFKLLKEGAAADKAIPLNILDWNQGNPLLSMPDEVQKDPAWKGKVQVFLDGTKKSDVPLTSSS
jgi:hypothetical protein